MATGWIFLLSMLTLSSSSIVKKQIEDIFNLDADETFAAEVGEDFYEARKRFQDLPKNSKHFVESLPFKGNLTNLHSNITTKAPNISTTESIQMATIPPDLSVNNLNLSLRELKKKRLLMHLEHVLESDRTVSDYIVDSDLNTLTQRFDQILDKHNVRFRTKTRREVYDEKEENTYVKVDAKKRLRDIMTHFVYVTRYKLSFAQLLRKKYYDSPVYKIGFLFALLRHLKNMQKWLYWPLETNGYGYSPRIVGTMFHDLKIIEKLQRLDVDVKDVVLLIQKSEYRGNMESNPKYYDYSLEKYT